MKIACIGAGSMAIAIISGLIEKEIVKKDHIYVTNRGNQKKLHNIEQQYGVKITYDTEELVQNAQLIILAVKPSDAQTAISKIQPYISEETMIISVMAGVSIELIRNHLKKDCAIARAMPNTSAAVGKSATALCFNKIANQQQINLALSIFSSIGMAIVVQEEEIDAITGLSGSGPAYIYYIVEAMEKAAEKIGLEADKAKPFIIQTLIGAAEMLATSGKNPTKLREEVTSPGGTTEAGLRVLQTRKVDDAIIECIQEATNQSKRLRQT